jgi:hypothetical protein
MIKAIIGRLPEGYPATLQGFELCIQTWAEIPDKAKEILSPPWSKDFKAYFLRPTLKPFKKVKGTVWLISREERKLIDNWELNGIWYQVYLLKFLKPANNISQIEIQVINKPKIEKIINGFLYRNFLNNKERMLQVAERVRKNFLKIN